MIRIFSVISIVIIYLFASGCATVNKPTFTGFRIVTIIYTDDGGVFYRSVRLLNNGDGGKILFPDNCEANRIVIGLFKDRISFGRREIIIRNDNICCLETENCKSNFIVGETILNFGKEKLSVYYHHQPSPSYMIFYQQIYHNKRSNQKGWTLNIVHPF